LIYDVLLRLTPDPYESDLARGWTAELADPAWMLGRQWQMGEHQGEDASSPVTVEITPQTTEIGAPAGQDAFDPLTTPAQAIVESEPYEWWTVGRRVRIGRAVTATAAAHGITLPEAVTLSALTAPYDRLNGSGADGRALWQQRGPLGLDPVWFGSPGPPATEPLDDWDPAELAYSAQLPAGLTTLTVTRHDGGDLDWYHADAKEPIGAPPASAADGGTAPPAGTAAGAATGPSGSGARGTGGSPPDAAVQTIPGRLRYPGAPLPRWWEIEDGGVSIGGQAPDRSSLATLLLIDLIVNHSSDWFTFSLPVRAGTIVTVPEVTVSDSFGDSWTITPPQDWTLFGTTGLDPSSIVVWATARTPLAGPVIDDVVIGIDEDANLVWAVEQIVAGQTLATPSVPPGPAPVQRDPSAALPFFYLPMTPIPAHWHPYVVDDVNGRRRFVQGRAADLSAATPALLPAPISDLLADPQAPPGGPVHQIEPATVPAEGMRIQRRTMLARSTTGEPVLWTQRRRDLLLAPPTFALRFDLMPQAPPDPAGGASA
jgi:hypothetical protein